MRIAQISPLYETVPPRWYGGTERIVSYLTEELVELGHDVTLFAAGESRTKAELVPVTETGLRLQKPAVRDPIAHHVRLLKRYSLSRRNMTFFIFTSTIFTCRSPNDVQKRA